MGCSLLLLGGGEARCRSAIDAWVRMGWPAPGDGEWMPWDGAWMLGGAGRGRRAFDPGTAAPSAEGRGDDDVVDKVLYAVMSQLNENGGGRAKCTAGGHSGQLRELWALPGASHGGAYTRRGVGMDK